MLIRWKMSHVSDSVAARAEWFREQQRLFNDAYLAPDNDEYQQSGWNGSAERWKAGRAVILDGITRNGDLLDVGCANGLLLHSLVAWAAERGQTVTPYGVDFVPGLIELAQRRFPEQAANFSVANAWDWQPERRYDYVHTLLELVPQGDQRAYLQRLLDEVVAPGGRLIVSNYGSRTENRRPLDVDLHLQMLGFHTIGCGNGREDDGWVATRTAWIDR